MARLLREQEAILNTASIGICFVRDRRIVRATRRFEQMHGYAPGELDGQPTSVTYADEATYRAIGEGYSRLRSGESYSAETLTRRKDGSTYWSRITGRAVDPADPALGSVWMDEDITEQKARRGRAAARARRAAGDRQQRGGRHRLPARAQDRALQPPLRGAVRLRARARRSALSTRQYYFTDEDFAAGGRYVEQLDAGPHARLRAMAAAQGRLGLLVPAHRARASSRATSPRATCGCSRTSPSASAPTSEIQRLAEEQRLILDNATVGIAFVRNHVVQRCNRYLEEMVGAAPGALIGTAVVGAVRRRAAVEWNEHRRLAYAQTAPGGTYDIETAFRRADGTSFRARTRGRRIDPGGEEQEWIWSLEDVDRWSARPRRACSARSSSRS